jgi:hypothetical protein
MFNVAWNASLILMNRSQCLDKTFLEIKFVCDLSIVTFSIWIFYICGNSLYQNFGLNNLYYIIIFIIFFLKEKESFHTSILHQVTNIILNATFLYVKQFFNTNIFFNEIFFSMWTIFQFKFFFPFKQFFQYNFQCK